MDNLLNAVYEALGFKSKPDVILPIGTSGSGKSTFVKSLSQENLVVISPDEMRVEFTGDINDKSKDKKIYEEATKRAIQAIKQGKQVVFDTTNLTKDKRLPFIEAIKKAIPTANIQYKLMELNTESAKQRIKAQLARGENRAAVSDETIDRHAASYKQMLEDIKNEPISNFEITHQQKQQAQQLYSQYLEQNPNGTVEGFKEFVKKDKEAAEKNIKNPEQKEEVDTDIELGIFGNSEGTLWSEYNGTEKDKINIEEALSFLEKNLPYVKAKVINSLLQMPNGGIAQGSYYNKLITLSRRGAKGTEYHEAFHAVLDLYLDENERQTLFEEYRKKNNSKLIDSKINEKLADEFKDYMLSNRELNIPSWLKPLYNALLDLINYFRSDRHKIFANIRAGRFNYAPINMVNRQSYVIFPVFNVQPLVQ